MAFRRVCSLNDLWQGEMVAFDVSGRRILLVHTQAGHLCATQAKCPHQDTELMEGSLEGAVLTCSMHQWQFDVTTGKGINPFHAEIALYPVRIEGDDVYVDAEGIEPKHAHS